MPEHPQPQARLTTMLHAMDSYALVCESIEQLFPACEFPERSDGEPEFPSHPVRSEVCIEDVDLSTFLEKVSNQRISDSAMDCMAENLVEDETRFRLSRQAALAGKISFVLAGEQAPGGVLEINLEGEHLAAWIEQATWHRGRDYVERFVGDENSMRRDGTPQEWFD